MSAHTPSPDTLRRLLDYDPASGVLRWKTRTADQFGSGDVSPQQLCSAWNGRRAGRPALTIKDRRRGGFVGRVLNARVAAHRVAWAITHGSWPVVIAHINGDRCDNRLANLCAPAEDAALRLRSAEGFKDWLAARVAVRDMGHETPCWIWQRELNDEGYARANLPAAMGCGDLRVRVHRKAYELLVGPIPDGLVSDHLCRVRSCVNPAHIEPVTIAENNRRKPCVSRLPGLQPSPAHASG